MHVSAMMKYHGVFCQQPASGGGVEASVEDHGGRGNEVPTLNLHLSKWRTWSRPRVTCARADEEVKASPARLTVPSSRSGRKTIAVSTEGGGGGGGLGRPGREPMREHAQNRPLTRRNL